ncbi:MAG: ferredoxin--NADP reductase [Bacteroidia bacterium]
MPKAYILTISDIVRETPDAVTIRFEQPSFGRIWYYPGQFITLRVEIDGVNHYRSYSISSVPQLDKFLSVTVKRVAGGLISNYIIDHFAPGKKVVVLEPRGKFYLETGSKNKRHIVLFGAGSGITPLISILRAVLYQEPASSVSLFYANRDEAQVIFGEWLTRLEKQFPQRLKIWYGFSRPDNPLAGNFYQGRITPEKMPQLLAAIAPGEKSIFFLCGPSGYMDAVSQGLAAAGIDKENIHRELFFADKDEKKLTAAFGPSREVTVMTAGQTYHLTVPPGTTILDAALSQKVYLPYSCRRGVCSTCMGTLKSGKVSMDQEDALLDFEKAMGYVLVCQAHPESDDVCIDIGES